jgi:zinc/manganese transport system substrate-binding protein
MKYNIAKKASYLLFLIALLVGVFFCPYAAQAGQKVVASVLPVYIFSKNVAGEKADVTLLIPPGTDVHEFSLRPLDLKTLHEADLVLISGAGLEDFILDRMGREGRIVDTSEGIELIRKGGSPDPHVWLDPLNAARQVENIRDALSALDPANRPYYERNAESYIGRLKALDVEIREGLGRLEGRYLITYHEAFNYFALRYGLVPFSLTGPDAEQPLPGRMRAVYDIVRKEAVRAIFSEEQFPQESLERLRKDLGVSICTLDTLETGTPDIDYYERAMGKNLRTILRCLGGK